MTDISLENLVALENRISEIGRTLPGAESEQDISAVVLSTVGLYRDIRDSGCYAYECLENNQDGGRLGPEPEKVKERLAGITESFESLLKHVAGKTKEAARIVSESLHKKDDADLRNKLARFFGLYQSFIKGVVQEDEDRFTYLFDDEIDSCMNFNISLLSLVRRYDSMVSSYLCSDISASVVSEKASEVESLMREVKALPKGFDTRGTFDRAYDVDAWLDMISLFKEELHYLRKPKRLDKVASRTRLLDAQIRFYSALVDGLDGLHVDSSEKCAYDLADFSSRLENDAGVAPADPDEVRYLSSRRQKSASLREKARLLIARKQVEAKEFILSDFRRLKESSPPQGMDDTAFYRQKLDRLQGLKRSYVKIFNDSGIFSEAERALSSVLQKAEAAAASERGYTDRVSQRSHEEEMARISANRDVNITRIEAERDVGVAMCVSSAKTRETDDRLDRLSGLYDSLKDKVDAMSSRICGGHRRDRPSYQEILQSVCG